MGGCGGGRGRGLCIIGRGGYRVGGCTIYNIYSCGVCGCQGIGCSVVDMFRIYIIYIAYRMWGIYIYGAYSIYRVMTSTIYNWVVNVEGLGGVFQL